MGIKMKIIILILALSAIASTAPLRQIMSNLQVSTHYEDPFNSSHKPSCTGSDEEPRTYPGITDFWACMPGAIGPQNECYGDYPPGSTAVPAPLYTDNDDGKIRCVQVCSGRALWICGGRAECILPP